MKPLSALQIRGDSASIDDVLKAFGAHQWTPRMISDHKLRELAKAPRASFLWPYRKAMAAIEAVTCVALVLSGIVLLVGACVWILSLPFWPMPFDVAQTISDFLTAMSHGLMTYSALVLIASVACIIPLVLFGDTQLIGPARWEAVSVGKAQNSMMLPMPALTLIESARVWNPDADIKIHMLMQDRTILDPVLEIEGRFPLVWDKNGNIILPPA